MLQTNIAAEPIDFSSFQAPGPEQKVDNFPDFEQDTQNDFFGFGGNQIAQKVESEQNLEEKVPQKNQESEDVVIQKANFNAVKLEKKQEKLKSPSMDPPEK